MAFNYIGTSGFIYSSWKNIFYPENISSKQWLEYYSSRFNTLEINNTFYRFPVEKNLNKFYHSTPTDFVFSVKAHKIITHSMRMKNALQKVEEFVKIIDEGLKEKLKCILFQLPPSFKYTEENLSNILSSLSQASRNVVELRHESWWNKEVVKAFRKHKLTFCNVSFPGLPEEFYQTSDKFYLRMHGVPELFKSSYSNHELSKKVTDIPLKSKERYIYFNNTYYDSAFLNAQTLKNLLDA